MRKTKLLKGFGLVTVVFIAFFSAALFWFYSAMPVFFLEAMWRIAFQKTATGTTVLVLGLDNDPYVKRTDTLMLLHLEEHSNTVKILSIPRDTLMNIPGMGLTKVNHAMGMGGLPLLKQSVSAFLELPIDYTVQVNLKAVEELIDLLGGIEVNVPKDLYYVDRAGGLEIDFKKGKQVLKGDQVASYARYRSDSEGDIGRIRRQQALLSTSMKQLRDRMSLPIFVKILPQIAAVIETDMPVTKMMQTLKFAFQFEKIDMESLMVPGRLGMINGISYWIPELDGIDSLVTHFLNAEQSSAPAVKKTVLLQQESQTSHTSAVKKSAATASSRKKNLEPIKNEQVEKTLQPLPLASNSAQLQEPEATLKADQGVAIEKLANNEAVNSDALSVQGLETQVEQANTTATTRASGLEKPAAVSLAQEAKPTAIKSTVLAAQTQNKQEPSQPSQTLEENNDTLETSSEPKTLKKIRIEILNGNGISGIAKKVGAFLTQQGFEVVKVGDAKDYNYQKSKLVDWKGDLEGSLKILSWFQMQPDDLVLRETLQKPLDMTLVIGHNWNEIEELIRYE